MIPWLRMDPIISFNCSSFAGASLGLVSTVKYLPSPLPASKEIIQVRFSGVIATRWDLTDIREQSARW